MFVEPVYTYGNIVSYNETINYYYKIKPINSLYAQDSQQSTLIENMMGKVQKINMPGMILIKPRVIDADRLIKNYEDLWKKNQRSILLPLKQEYMKSVKKTLNKSYKYQYDIYFIFTDGRPELKHKRHLQLMRTTNDPLPDRVLEVCRVVDEEIYNTLNVDLSVERLQEDAVQNLHQYLSLPVEDAVEDYYTIPQPTELEVTYKSVKVSGWKKSITRTFVASDFKRTDTEVLQANSVLNKLQLGTYPVDTIIKFDLEHTAKFSREMLGKKEQIRKSHKRYFNSSDKKDNEAIKAIKLANIGVEADETKEEFKVRWQMMIRIRANDQEMLNKRSDALMRRFQGAGITLSYELGEQDKLANNLFPFKQTYKNHVQLTDVAYFCQFNYLGGLYIGEETEGVIVTFTKPGELPVIINPYAPIEGKSKSASPTTIFVGETGAGKSQQANEIALVLMIFYGVDILCVDPKGDRLELANLLGDKVCSHLVLGSKACQNGMFDPYLLSDDKEEVLSSVQREVTAFLRAINPDVEIDFGAIKKADANLRIDFENKVIDRMTLRTFISYLAPFDKKAAGQLEGLKDDPNARLFFGDAETDIDQVFDLSKPFNLVTFESMPLYSKDQKVMLDFNPNEKDHRLFSILFSRLGEVINRFMKTSRKEKLLAIDEVRIFTAIPGAMDIITNVNRQARTWYTLLFLMSQRLSDFPDDVLENTGQFFVGSLKSNKEIQFVLDFMSLDHKSSVASILQDRTKDEGLNQDRKYNFLYCDYNNRKAITKAIFGDVFKDAFNTLRKGDET